jgi:rhodanese-related sulfurtransferase/DNA-binding transcriptional ArsR family regulator
MAAERKRAFKTALFDEFARIGKALASGRRLELLELLAQGERSVEELAHETEMSVANASQHLQVLRAAHLVEARRDRLYTRYRLGDPSVLHLWRSLREVGESQIAHVERVAKDFFADRAGLKAVTSAELREQLKAGTALVLDVRPKQEFVAGHILGARSIPVEELKQRLKELPKTKTIVAYCRGPYCVFADEAVQLLQKRGYKAARLTEGFPDWWARGYPIETAHPA